MSVRKFQSIATGKTSRRLFIVGASAGLLAGCATGARPTALVAPPTARSIVRDDEAIYRTIAIGSVSGGRETDVISGSQISSGDFRQALDTSLDLTGLRANDSGSLILDVIIEQVDQEIFDINLDVTTTVFYRLRGRDGRIVDDRRITETYEARFSESFIRSERFRLANEGSGRANIAAYIDGLVADFRANPDRFAPSV